MGTFATVYPVSDVVLIHGSTQSPSGFDGLASALRSRGHRVLLADLPTDEPTWTATRFAEVVAGQHLRHVDAPIVVAHSASGLLLPSIGSALGARHQVWMAAAVPDFVGRRSLMEELGSEPTKVFNPEWVGVDPTADPVLATYLLFHDCRLAGLQAALPTLRPCDLRGAYTETPPADPTQVPGTYLLPTGDRALQPRWMRTVARDRLGVEPVELPGGHNLYCAAPDMVADAIHAIR